ncbi:unnamed protein product [Trichobilharzia szidati]|nr:unnamed protein product [Trichobilharzia szidati]
MRCIIPDGPYVVIWNKIGMEYPLTIGKRRFIPDSRISVKYKPPDRWRLRITNARLTDSGVYTCTMKAIHKEEEEVEEHSTQSNDNKRSCHKINGNNNSQDISENSTLRLSNPDYYITVVEPEVNEHKQTDAPPPVVPKTLAKNPTLTVTGPKVAYYGRPLELKCYAKFPTSFQISDYEIILEWYHKGIRRKSDPYNSGSLYIEQRWLNSNTLESRLYIKQARETDTGQWICLERYKSVEKARHDLSKYMHLPPEHKNLHTRDQSSNGHPSKSLISNDLRLPPLSSIIPTSKVTYGRIEVEILDMSKASIHLKGTKSDNTRHVYSYIHPNSKLLRTISTNSAHNLKSDCDSFIKMYLSTIVILCFSTTKLLTDVIM